MTSLRRLPSQCALSAALVLSVLLLAAAVSPASASYAKPAGGGWTFQDAFDDTDGGAFALSRDAATVVKLVLEPGEDSAEDCGTAPIRLVSRPRVKSHRSVSGRYAVGKLERGLFVPTPMRFKQGRATFRASLLLLWDTTGRLLSSGQLDRGDCHISFHAHTGR